VNLGRVIGNVWATRKVASFEGRRLMVVQPLTFDREPAGDPFVAIDTVNSGVGDYVMVVTSTEATVPFKPLPTPTDAAIVGVVEQVETERGTWSAPGRDGP
jgi:ethanolamine utilization protein EutN